MNAKSKYAVNPAAAIVYGLDSRARYYIVAKRRAGRGVICTLEDTKTQERHEAVPLKVLFNPRAEAQRERNRREWQESIARHRAEVRESVKGQLCHLCGAPATTACECGPLCENCVDVGIDGNDYCNGCS